MRIKFAGALLLVALIGGTAVLFKYKIADVRAEERFRFYNVLHGFYLKQLGQSQEQGVIIVGDSLVQGMLVSNLSANALNFGIGGDTYSRAAKRLQDYINLRPSYSFVILLGTNDLLHSPAGFEVAVSRFVDVARHAKRLYWVLIPPARGDRISEKSRNESNDRIIDECRSLAQCRVLEGVGAVQVETLGMLADDGIHFTEAGARVLAGQLKSQMTMVDSE